MDLIPIKNPMMEQYSIKYVLWGAHKIRTAYTSNANWNHHKTNITKFCGIGDFRLPISVHIWKPCSFGRF